MTTCDTPGLLIRTCRSRCITKKRLLRARAHWQEGKSTPQGHKSTGTIRTKTLQAHSTLLSPPITFIQIIREVYGRTTPGSPRSLCMIHFKKSSELFRSHHIPRTRYLEKGKKQATREECAYFLEAFWAALVTLPALSALTTDLMTPTATV